MSTLMYSVRTEGSAQQDRSVKDQRRVTWVILLVAVAIGPGVFVVHRVVSAVVWRSFLTETLSLCLYAGAAVWYGLRIGPASPWREALKIYLLSLGIMGFVDFVTKRGLDVSLAKGSRASDPILLAGVVMMLFLPLFGWMVRRYPLEMKRVGLGFASPRVRLRWLVVAGLGVGLLIGFHFLVTAKMAGLELKRGPWPYGVWQVFYELGPQALPEELFMRGVVFNELYFRRERGFWTAALATSGLELLSLLVRQDPSADGLVIVALVFYTVVSGIASAGLFRWSRSVVPGYVNNIVLGAVSMSL